MGGGIRVNGAEMRRGGGGVLNEGRTEGEKNGRKNEFERGIYQYKGEGKY